jgi:hypothetical protein
MHIFVSIIGLGGAHLTPPTREEAVNSAWLTGCVLPWTDSDLYRLGFSLTMTDSRHDGDQGLEVRMPVTGVAAAGQDLTAGRVAPNGKFFEMRGVEADTGDGTVETEREICQEKGGALIARDTGNVGKNAVQDRETWTKYL